MSSGDMGGSENMGESKLKPCPFCGGNTKMIDTALKIIFWVRCTECGASISAYGNIEDAERAWNNRAGKEGEAE